MPRFWGVSQAASSCTRVTRGTRDHTVLAAKPIRWERPPRWTHQAGRGFPEPVARPRGWQPQAAIGRFEAEKPRGY